MTIRSLLIRFTIIYTALLALIAILFILFNVKANPATNTGALIAAVFLVCNQFFSKNKRNFTATEKKTVIIIFCLINLLLQIIAALIVGAFQLPLATLLMVSFLIVWVHSAMIYYIVGMAEKQYAKRAGGNF